MATVALSPPADLDVGGPPLAFAPTGGGGRCQSILVTYASAADDGVLDRAVSRALQDGARLTIIVPIVAIGWCVPLAVLDVDLSDLRKELEQAASATACQAAGRVPSGLALTVRCVHRNGERELRRKVADGSWDLYVARPGRRDPGTLFGRLGLRLTRCARRSGVRVLLVSAPRAVPAA